ncbi:hypothetical protein [Nevskia sp.]|uniref:hypothetical protein n=1 Tax=Nevskia sp. TaxID=1929292 RepID=UPI0025D9E182|nr:hypothetical protein [Nevskia sp.]
MNSRGIVESAAVAVCAVLAGCGLSERTLQCHDDDVRALISETIYREALPAAIAAVDSSDLREPVSAFPTSHPLALAGIVERERREGGGIACQATLSLPYGDAAVTPAAVSEEAVAFVQRAIERNAFGDRLIRAKRLAPVLEYLPDDANGAATWRIEYDVNFTSDRKQIVVSTDRAKGIALWVGEYIAAVSAAERELSLGSTKADDYEADSLDPDDAPQESPPALVN